MIDLKLRAGGLSNYQNSTLIRLLIEYRHAGAMLASCAVRENESLQEVLQQTAQTIEQELLKREASSTMITHLIGERAVPQRALVGPALSSKP